MEDIFRGTIIGPLAAGKELISTRVASSYGLFRVCTGDICRALAKEFPWIDDLIHKQGKLVPDKVILERFKQEVDGVGGFIADGIPRTVEQYRVVQEISPLDFALYLAISYETSKQRQLGRRVCGGCGLVYNVDFPDLRPVIDGFCDRCHSELTIRDDAKEKVILRRHTTYVAETEPLLELYSKAGILIEIDGEQPLNQVWSDVLEALNQIR